MDPRTGEVFHNPTPEQIKQRGLVQIDEADLKLLDSLDDPLEKLIETRTISWKKTAKKDFQGAVDKARRCNAFRDGWGDAYGIIGERLKEKGIDLDEQMGLA